MLALEKKISTSSFYIWSTQWFYIHHLSSFISTRLQIFLFLNRQMRIYFLKIVFVSVRRSCCWVDQLLMLFSIIGFLFPGLETISATIVDTGTMEAAAVIQPEVIFWIVDTWSQLTRGMTRGQWFRSRSSRWWDLTQSTLIRTTMLDSHSE